MVPKEESRKAEWAAALKISLEDLKDTKTKRICRLHFDRDKDFREIGNSGKFTVKDNVVPRPWNPPPPPSHHESESSEKRENSNRGTTVFKLPTTKNHPNFSGSHDEDQSYIPNKAPGSTGFKFNTRVDHDDLPWLGGGGFDDLHQGHANGFLHQKEDEDWRSTLQFTASNPSFPIEVFISIMDHEASVNRWSDNVVVDQVLSRMDFLTQSEKDKIAHLGLWSNVKSYLILQYTHEPTLTEKIMLLKSLFKAPSEKYPHYLIRVKYAARKLMELAPCQCASAKASSELEKLLFFAGLDEFDWDIYDPSSPSNLDVLVDRLTTSVKTEPEEVDNSVEVEIKESDVNFKQEEVEAEDDYMFPEQDFVASDDESDITWKNGQRKSGKKRKAIDDENGEDLDPDGVPKVKNDSDVKPRKKIKLKKVKSDVIAKTYPCKECSEVFSGKNELRKHKMTQHKKQFLYFCHICNANFGKDGLNKHVLEVHNGMRFKCSSCEQLFSTQVKLDHHMILHHDGGNSDAYKAIEGRLAAGEVFIDKNPKKTEPLARMDPKIGQDPHDPEISVYKCLFCNEVIEGVRDFGKHCLKEHEGKKYKCDMCDFAHKTLSSVFEHRFKIHNCVWGEMSPLYCKIDGCSSRTLFLPVLIHHIKHKHERKFEQQCHLCPSILQDSEKLRNHIERSHLGIKEFKCDQCDYITAYKKHLFAHQQTHLPEEERQKFICDECGNGYTNKAYLNNHINAVHKQIKNHKCPHCPDTAFSNSNKLKVHLRSAHQIMDKRHPCPECGKELPLKSLLLKHIEAAHTDIRHFRCKMCDTFFKRGENLAMHIAVKHMGFSTKEARASRKITQDAKTHPAYEIASDPKSKASKIKVDGDKIVTA